MVSIVLGAALGTVAESMADARKYLEEKKAGLENLYITSGFDSRKKLLEKRLERAAQIKEAESFGLSEQTAMAMQVTGQLGFELAKLNKIGKDKVSETYIRSLDKAVQNAMEDDEEIANAISEGISALKKEMSMDDFNSGIARALAAKTMKEYSEAVSGLTVASPSLPKVKEFEYRTLGGRRVETSEINRMNVQIAESLKTTFGEGYRLDNENGLTVIQFEDNDLRELFTELSIQAKNRVETAVPGVGTGSPADVSLFIGQTLQNARREDESGQAVVSKPSEILNNLPSILNNPTGFNWDSLLTEDEVNPRENTSTQPTV
tara:strand:- start:380 stop:1339 length:960 start_codon:yes stop_codon:yes gene_type:complete